MKKSNKLLLGGFLAVVLLISVIHVSLYAKYKAGDFTLYNPQDDLAPQAMQSFPNIAFVSVRNVNGATVKFTDTAQVEKSHDGAVQYIQKGDTLLISGREKADQHVLDYPVTLYLPHNATLSVRDSYLYFQNGKTTTESNPVIYLVRSTAIFSAAQNLFRLGHVKIRASDNSVAAFRSNTSVNHLELRLSNSAIDNMDGDFGQLSIETDSLSRLSLQSKHLLKANIKTIAPQ